MWTASCVQDGSFVQIFFFIFFTIFSIFWKCTYNTFPNNKVLHFFKLILKEPGLQKMIENLYSIHSHGAGPSIENYYKSNFSFFLRKGNMKHSTHTIFKLQRTRNQFQQILRNKNSSHLLSAYYVPGNVLSGICWSLRLIFTAVLWSRD